MKARCPNHGLHDIVSRRKGRYHLECGDWVPESTLTALTVEEELSETSEEKARRLGTEVGLAAASWVFDGNTSLENYQMFLKLNEDGDPALYEVYGPPLWLSGEHADERTVQSLTEELEASDDDIDELCDAYEEAADAAYWAELERVARLHVMYDERKP